MKFTLPARKPFSFLSVVNSHGWHQLVPFSYDENSNTLCYILRLSNGRVIELRLHNGGDGVVVETEKLNRTERAEVAVHGRERQPVRFLRSARRLAHAPAYAPPAARDGSARD